MRKTVALPFIALTLAAVVAAGCSGNGYNAATANATPTPFPSPTASCTPPAGYTIQQVFPQVNASNQPNLEGVVFAIGPSPQPGTGAPSPLPSNWYIYAKSSFGSTQGTNSIGFLATPVPAPGSTAGTTPTPLPNPSDTPLMTNYIYESASLGTFANNNTTFTIYLANTNCSTGLTESTFTTSTNDSPTPTPTPTST